MVPCVGILFHNAQYCFKWRYIIMQYGSVLFLNEYVFYIAQCSFLFVCRHIVYVARYGFMCRYNALLTRYENTTNKPSWKRAQL